MPLPRQLAPMKATAGDLPRGVDWRFELKWDGMRIVAFVEGGSVRLQSVNLNDVTVRFPELAALAEACVGVEVILDGEVVAFDDEGRPSFSALQHRMHVADPAEATRRAATHPVMFAVFDLLQVDDTPLLDVPWHDRRRLLVQTLDRGPSWTVPEVHDDGEALIDAATSGGLEGIVAKRIDSTYRPGARTTSWRKVKVRLEQEFVVGGWIEGQRSLAGRLGSVVIGHHDRPGGDLVFAGRVGSGIDDAMARELESLLAPLARDDPPFTPAPPAAAVRGAHWTDPALVVQVAFAEWTPDGRLRHPAFVGRRDDVEPAEVVRES